MQCGADYIRCVLPAQPLGLITMDTDSTAQRQHDMDTAAPNIGDRNDTDGTMDPINDIDNSDSANDITNNSNDSDDTDTTDSATTTNGNTNNTFSTDPLPILTLFSQPIILCTPRLPTNIPNCRQTHHANLSFKCIMQTWGLTSFITVDSYESLKDGLYPIGSDDSFERRLVLTMNLQDGFHRWIE